MATYSIDGEQYVVALSFVGGDYVTAFKLGGTLGELPTPVLSAGAIRQGAGGTPTAAHGEQHVYLARSTDSTLRHPRQSAAIGRDRHGGMHRTTLAFRSGPP
jgi:hypothetical protein